MTESPPRVAAAAEPQQAGVVRFLPRLTPFSAFLALAVAVAALAAVTTDGFLTVANLKAILFSGSFVGIAAVGTTVLMLSGNLFSLSLGTTISVGAIAFLSALHLGLAVAIVLTLLLGLAIFAAQGAIVGVFDANPIIVSIAAGAIQAGLVTWLTSGTQVVASGSGTAWQTLGGSVLGIPFGFYVLVGFTLVAAFLTYRTTFGRALYLIGENRRAARGGRPAGLARDELRLRRGGSGGRHARASSSGRSTARRRCRSAAPTPTTRSRPRWSAVPRSRAGTARCGGPSSARSSSRASPICCSCAGTRPASRSSSRGSPS